MRWDGSGDIALGRFDDYWGPTASTQSLIFVTDTDATRRLAKLREASVDGIDLVAPNDIEDVQANPELTLAHRQGLNTAYIGLNNRFAPFDNESGPPGHLGRHRPGGDRRRELPAGHRRGDAFPPLRDPVRLRGRRMDAT